MAAPPSDSHPPRLREAHCHLHAHGQAAAMVNLDHCRSLGECLDTIRSARDQRLSPRGWLLARSARPESWPEHRWPTRAELDQACPDLPLVIWCFDHHALCANSRALAIAGVVRATPDPEGGVIERDATGEPTGLMLEAATRLVWSKVPEPTPEQRKAHVLLALLDLAAKGFIEAHDMLSHDWLGPILAELRREAGSDGLPCAVHLYPLVEDLERIASTRAAWESAEVRLAGGKVFTDGTINSRTAWMLEPFAEPIPSHPRGTPLMSVDQIAGAIRTCTDHGLHLAAHAIGDGAVRACLDAAELAQSTPSGPPSVTPSLHLSATPLRIEHAELIDEADVPRFAKLGVVASVQPCHLLADIEALRRLLPHRLSRVFPLRELIDAGCRPGELLWFGSDTPIVRPDAEDSIRAAVHRRRADMPAAEAIAPEQAVAEPEAWGAFVVP
ncbi:MAG: amidohydrolase family protein [Phycisphaeraceae bacterium]|nr:amidohydrolase family protein [Phycisphaeraceae bacterium]